MTQSYSNAATNSNQKAVSNQKDTAQTSTCYLTVCTRIDGKPAGKTYTLANGEVTKEVAGHSGRYTALRHRVASLSELSTLLASLTPAQTLIYGHCVECGDLPYQILPDKTLRERLNVGERQLGVHHINGKTTIGRFKENFTSGGLLFVDRDRQPSMPAQLETASDDDFFAQLERLVPGISSAERLAYSSSSSRVLLPDGLPAFNGTPSRHYWLRLATDIDQDSIRLALTVAAGAADLMFTATDKHGKKRLNRTVLDLSVYSTEREIFDSPPAVNAPLQCAKGDYQISNLGGGSVIIEPAWAGAIQSHAKRTKTTITRSGAGSFTGRVDNVLTLQTELETANGIITVKQWLDSGQQKTRIQSPFRIESKSFAAFIDRTEIGCFVFDSGTNETYFLEKEAPADDFKTCFESLASVSVLSTITDSAAIKSDLAQAMEKASAFADEINAQPDTLPAPSAQREFVLPAAIKDCLVLIERAENPVQVARKVLLRQVPRLPLEITSPELIAAVCGAIPECTDETRLALSGALDEAITTAIRRAREDNQLNANLTLDSIQEVIPAMRTLWAQGHRCFLIRAPMGSGKTQLVLKAIFDQINNVVALTYSTTLVDNLVSRFEGATHYQDMAVDECALVEKIVACINSIGKINIRKSLDAAKAILADEIAHVARVLYDPDGTLKSTAGAITRQFFDAIKATVKHGIFAGVDANLNDLTVAAFRHNGAKPYVIDVVDHNPPKPMKIHRSKKRIWWSASNEVNDGGRVFIACSGAKESLRVDRHLRAQCPGKKGLVINSRGGYATSGDPNQRAWFKDVNGLVVQYDWIIFSPAVESGVSIEVKHFTKWFGIYDGTKCASDFHQMLARDRTATGYEVAITGTLKKPAPRTAKEELADALYCAHLDHGSIIEASSYDVVAAVFEVVRKRRVQYYGQEFCCLSQDLFDVEIDRKEVNDSEFNAYQKKIWDSIESEFVADVKDRPALSEATFEQIASNYTPDRYDSQDVHAHTITKALGIPLSELTTQAVNIYHEGRITSQLERFRFATEPDRVVESTADDIGVLDVMLRRNRKAVAQACRVFYQELGLDFFNLQSTRKRKGRLVTSDEIKGITAAGAVDLLNRLATHDDAAAIRRYLCPSLGVQKARVYKLAAEEKTTESSQVIRTVNSILGNFGYWLVATGDSGNRVYKLAAEEKTTESSQVKIPGGKYMIALAARLVAENQTAKGASWSERQTFKSSKTGQIRQQTDFKPAQTDDVEIAENPAKWGKSDSSREYSNNGSCQHKAAILAEPEHACPEILEFANRYLADIGEHDAVARSEFLSAAGNPQTWGDVYRHIRNHYRAAA